MSDKPNYPERDVQYAERIYLLGLKEYLSKNPGGSESDFLEKTIEELRAKVDQLKGGFNKSKNDNKSAEAFYKENLRRQTIYLELSLEKKMIFDNKKPEKKSAKAENSVSKND